MVAIQINILRGKKITEFFSMSFLKYIRFKIVRKFYLYLHQQYDSCFDTHIKQHFDVERPWLFINVTKLDVTGIDNKIAAWFLAKWRSHCFDLLGSDWVCQGFLNNAPGIEGYRYSTPVIDADREGKWLESILERRHLRSAKKIWRLVSEDYKPIDWQKDFKSGYRWNVKTWYNEQKWADKSGGDIKVPWELSRLQHLPRMAVFAWLLPEEREKTTNEFRNQCLDFITQNPPRFGVNWKCTMDVGIRTANLVLAYSLFSTSGINFDNEFNNIFLQSIYEHCAHIRSNLEYSYHLTSNHYLADITGLLFGAALLPSSRKRRQWLRFACKEIKLEIKSQFYPEGSNFEGSTAYHRLSSDMAAYSVALIAALEGKDVDAEITDRLYGAAKFLCAVTRPDNAFSQIGDNDSGMFFRLSPTGDNIDENMNDGRATISALAGLFDTNEFDVFKKTYPLECSIVQSLRGDFVVKSNWKEPKAHITALASNPELSYTKETIIQSDGVDLLENIERIDFPCFGIYIFRSSSLYLLVCAADNGQKGNGGHAHNDKASFELFINGKVLYEDPGTFCYTALPELRNKYRSVKAHNTIQTGIEQNEFVSLFSMKNQSRCTLLSISETGICILTEYRGVIHTREFIIESMRIIINDKCNMPFEFIKPNCPITAGYGKIKNESS
jgi:hypothetical protein